jgi:hypothetical protein
MKKLVRPAIMIGLSLAVALFGAAITYKAQASPLPSLSGATLSFQTTPTPQVQDNSKAGSTDQIIIMGGLIVLIIFMPIFLNRRTWRH